MCGRHVAVLTEENGQVPTGANLMEMELSPPCSLQNRAVRAITKKEHPKMFIYLETSRRANILGKILAHMPSQICEPKCCN